MKADTVIDERETIHLISGWGDFEHEWTPLVMHCGKPLLMGPEGTLLPGGHDFIAQPEALSTDGKKEFHCRDCLHSFIRTRWLERRYAMNDEK